MWLGKWVPYKDNSLGEFREGLHRAKKKKNNITHTHHMYVHSYPFWLWLIWLKLTIPNHIEKVAGCQPHLLGSFTCLADAVHLLLPFVFAFDQAEKRGSGIKRHCQKQSSNMPNIYQNYLLFPGHGRWCGCARGSWVTLFGFTFWKRVGIWEFQGLAPLYIRI